MQVLTFIVSSIAGFLVFFVLTNPRSKIHRKLPKIKISRVQLFPVIIISVRGKIIHLHHWLGFGIILIASVFTESGILSYLFIKGILSGGIIQGLFAPQSMRLIYKKNS